MKEQKIERGQVWEYITPHGNWYTQIIEVDSEHVHKTSGARQRIDDFLTKATLYRHADGTLAESKPDQEISDRDWYIAREFAMYGRDCKHSAQDLLASSQGQAIFESAPEAAK